MGQCQFIVGHFYAAAATTVQYSTVQYRTSTVVLYSTAIACFCCCNSGHNGHHSPANKDNLHTVYLTVLYCTVLYCTVLYCTVLYCTALYCTVLCCTVLYCIITIPS